MDSKRQSPKGVRQADPGLLEELGRLRKRVADLEAALPPAATDYGEEARLRDERHRILTENTEIGLWQVDRTGRTLYLNPAMRTMLEIEDDEDVSNRTYQEFFTQESLNRVEQEHVSRRQGVSTTYEAELVGQKGTHRHVIVCGAGLAGRTGELGNTLGTVTDITALKNIEATLHSGEEFLRVVMESAIDSILVFREGEERILYCNAATEEIFGHPVDELHGSPVTELFTKESSAALHEEMDRLLRLKTDVPFGEILEVNGRHLSGVEVPLEISLTGTRVDNGPAFIATIRNIAERKQQQAALLEEKEKYRSFFMDDLTGDYVSTPEHGIIECNPAFARIFGFDSVQEALESDPRRLYPKSEDRVRFLERLREEKILVYVEEELRRKDGTPVHIVQNTSGIFDESGELIGFKGYVFDITDHKIVEEQFRQAQKMEAVGRLAGGVAHDFNNVLTAILGYTDLLLGAVESGSQMHRQLEEIRKAGDRASSLTRQLLAFSRRQVLKPIVLDLNEVVRDMEEMLRRLLPEPIGLDLHLEAVHPVKADPVQIQQVVLNLAVNARDAMPRGGTIDIRTRNAVVEVGDRIPSPGLDPGEYAVLVVKDTGVGMSEETVSRMFEPFFTTKEQGEGTGLGLSTVYGIIKQSGGDVRVRSSLDHGSTFELFLPRMKEHAEGTHASSASSDAPTGYETILLVEDEEPVRKMVREILEINGHTVLEASCGEEAVLIGENHDGSIHMLLTDVVMPDIRGTDLARRLTLSRPDLRVAYMSGYAGGEALSDDIEELGRAFIQKPFRAIDLMSHVRRILDSEID